MAIGHGLVVTALLYLAQLVIGAFSDGFVWPFSVWWGMLACLPGIGMGIWALVNNQ